MTSQVILEIDRKLKDRAEKKARYNGISLFSILTLATEAYVRGTLDVQVTPRLNAKTRKVLAQELREIKAKRNISPRFSNATAAVTFLKNL